MLRIINILYTCIYMLTVINYVMKNWQYVILSCYLHVHIIIILVNKCYYILYTYLFTFFIIK